MMVNPASAEFYNLKRAVKMLDEPVDTICGYVKGKNASGGDTEEMPFLYIIRDDRDGEAYLVDGRSYVAQTVRRSLQIGSGTAMRPSILDYPILVLLNFVSVATP